MIIHLCLENWLFPTKFALPAVETKIFSKGQVQHGLKYTSLSVMRSIDSDVCVERMKMAKYEPANMLAGQRMTKYEPANIDI